MSLSRERRASVATTVLLALLAEFDTRRALVADLMPNFKFLKVYSLMIEKHEWITLGGLINLCRFF